MSWGTPSVPLHMPMQIFSWIHNEYAKKVGKISFHFTLKWQVTTGSRLEKKNQIKEFYYVHLFQS